MHLCSFFVVSWSWFLGQNFVWISCNFYFINKQVILYKNDKLSHVCRYVIKPFLFYLCMNNQFLYLKKIEDAMDFLETSSSDDEFEELALLVSCFAERVPQLKTRRNFVKDVVEKFSKSQVSLLIKVLI